MSETRPTEGFAGAQTGAGLLGGAAVFPLGVLAGLQLMDWAVQSAFNVLIPNVRDTFHLSDAGVLAIVAAAGAAALLCTLPVAFLADRFNRVLLVFIGACVSAVFCFGIGVAPTAILLTVALAGASMGQAVIFPTHNSLIADFYPIGTRPKVYAIHRGGMAIGAIFGVLIGAGLADAFGWRSPFVVFAVPIVIFAILGSRLAEPRRGRHEQAALAAMTGEALDSDTSDVPNETPPSLGEAWRLVWKISVLRRMFWALPFLAASVVGFTSLASLQYQRTFGLDVLKRAFLVAPVQVFDVIGVVIGAVVATRLVRRSPRLMFSLLAAGAVSAAGFSVLFALAPNVPLAFVGNAGIDASLALVGPGVLAALSLAIPPRARSIGFSIGALFVLPGLLVIPLVGAIGDEIGLRYGLLILVPVFLVGAIIVATGGSLIEDDITDVWTSIRTRSEMLAGRKAGELPLLAVRDICVDYNGVNAITDVTAGVAEGEVVAVIGTNGAGKSTLLRAISGVSEARSGAVIFDGRDITHMPPDEIARLGIAQVPGGEGVFPNLTVQENLRTASWAANFGRSRPDPGGGRVTGGQVRAGGRDLGAADAEVDNVLNLFPVLAGRLADRAGDLSGGQQQMLTLAMSLLSRPRLLLIDELSLGLSPIVVEQLLASVTELARAGTAVLLVEQSVNVAVSVASRAYIMELGRVRFSGSTQEIRNHPELLFSVFLQSGLATASDGSDGDAATGLVTASGDSGGDTSTGLVTASDSSDGDTSVQARNDDRAVPTKPNPDVALNVEALSVTFGGIAALDDVTFSLSEGEILGVIGPNGAGKTTLFDAISGFTRRRAGRIEMLGADLTRMTPAARARRGLGRSFQDSRLFGSLTVAETLSVALERFIDVGDPLNAALQAPSFVMTEAAVTGRVEELLSFFGLRPFAHHSVQELSTGTRRLVDLAAVIAHQPKVVLLDEPSSGVAQREVEQMGNLLRRVRQWLGASFVVVEHDLSFIGALADRLVALDQGRVLADGPPTVVLATGEVIETFTGANPLARSSGIAQHDPPSPGDDR